MNGIDCRFLIVVPHIQDAVDDILNTAFMSDTDVTVGRPLAPDCGEKTRSIFLQLGALYRTALFQRLTERQRPFGAVVGGSIPQDILDQSFA